MKISLAQWSLHREFFEGVSDPLTFAAIARNVFSIEAVEYVNVFLGNAEKEYVAQVKHRADDAGVRSLLIMVDREGNLGDPDERKRTLAVENHYKWIEAAASLGCHSLRVNAASGGTYEEQLACAADGISRLLSFARPFGINVIIENHGGLSSNGMWLSALIKNIDDPKCGTLPDFGNWKISDTEEYDRYKGMAEIMPFAKGVSAKSYDFDASGQETTIDYTRMLDIVQKRGYTGYIDIEYEGSRLSEREGIWATKKLLDMHS